MALMKLPLIAILCCIVGFASCTALVCDYTPEDVASIQHKTIQMLKQKGWKVQKGYMIYILCNYMNEVFCSCRTLSVQESSLFGANPGNPYVLYKKPVILKSDLPVFGLHSRSAAIFIGCTPPDAAYFSWRSYAFTTHKHVVFASLGDSLNNLVINTTGAQHNSSGKATAVVTAVDGTVYNEISSMIAQAGLPKSAVNLDAVSPALVDINQTEFMMLHRASVWKDESVKKAYFNQTREVLFVEAPESVPSSPFPVPTLRKRGTGQREADLPGVSDGLATLEEVVKSQFENHNYVTAGRQNTSDFPLDGMKCLRNFSNCLGDNHDTNYVAFAQHSDTDPLKDNDVYVVIGTNSAETKKATYTNIGIYRVPIVPYSKYLATNITVSNKMMPGSAESYFTGLPADVSKHLFAYTFARDCHDLGKYCQEVDTTQLPVRDNWRMAYRTVLEPATGTGPLISELVLPIVLHFKGPDYKWKRP